MKVPVVDVVMLVVVFFVVTVVVLVMEVGCDIGGGRGDLDRDLCTSRGAHLVAVIVVVDVMVVMM